MRPIPSGCWLEAAQEIEKHIESMGLPVFKALDPLDKDDFVTLVGRVQRKLQRASSPIDKAAVSAALSAVDVDWANLTPRQRTAAARAANTAIREATDRVVPEIQPILFEDRLDIVGRTKRSVRRTHEFDVSTSLSATDRRIARRAVDAQTNFVTNEYGDRALSVEQEVRSIVAGGLERGLGRDEIASRIESRVNSTLIGRSASYWNVVSASFMNRSRTYTQLQSFEEAGVETYVFEAVLDRATTEQCRFLHGTRFPVGDARRHMLASDSAADPLDLKNSEPWLRTGRDENGTFLFTKNRQGVITRIADVIRSGVGQRDRVGEYRRLVSDEQLLRGGIPWPPLHGLCRSTILPGGI